MQNILFLLLFLMSCNESPTTPDGSGPSCDNPMLFMLQDLNTTSSTYGDIVGPTTWEGQIRLFYFSSNEQ